MEKKGGREKRKERAISFSFYIGASQVALVVKNPSANVRDAGEARDVGSIPGLGRSPGEANGNPLQYSCLENPMDRGTWWAIIHGVSKSLSVCVHTHIHIHRHKIRKNVYITHPMTIYISPGCCCKSEILSYHTGYISSLSSSH